MEISFFLPEKVLLLDAVGHLQQGRGIANDFKAHYVLLSSPVDGQGLLFQEEGGGLWIRITDTEGRRWEFAHMSERFIKTNDQIKRGQKLGITGDTGTITTGPHSHLQIYNKNGQRIDPWPLLINAPLPMAGNPYDNKIIRHQDLGMFAYVKGGTGKKQIITKEKAGFALITFIQRSNGAVPIPDQIKNVTPAVWGSFIDVPDGTWF